MANINDISGADRVLILGTREMLIYPFTAPNWTDLRLGWFLSICSVSNDQTITGLTETLSTTGTPDNRCWLGLKNNSNDSLPTLAGTVFIGSSEQETAPDGSTASNVATANSASEWTVYTDTGTLGIRNQDWDGTTRKAVMNSPVHNMLVPQNAGTTGGHGALILHQFTRSTGTSTTITHNAFTTTQGAYESSTLLFSDTPTIASIRAQFRNLAAYTTRTIGPSTFSVVPDAVYAYWPFNNSKLRIHSVCVEKFA